MWKGGFDKQKSRFPTNPRHPKRIAVGKQREEGKGGTLIAGMLLQLGWIIRFQMRNPSPTTKQECPGNGSDPPIRAGGQWNMNERNHLGHCGYECRYGGQASVPPT